MWHVNTIKSAVLSGPSVQAPRFTQLLAGAGPGAVWGPRHFLLPSPGATCPECLACPACLETRAGTRHGSLVTGCWTMWSKQQVSTLSSVDTVKEGCGNIEINSLISTHNDLFLFPALLICDFVLYLYFVAWQCAAVVSITTSTGLLLPNKSGSFNPGH